MTCTGSMHNEQQHKTTKHVLFLKTKANLKTDKYKFVELSTRPDPICRSLRKNPIRPDQTRGSTRPVEQVCISHRCTYRKIGNCT